MINNNYFSNNFPIQKRQSLQPNASDAEKTVQNTELNSQNQIQQNEKIYPPEKILENLDNYGTGLAAMLSTGASNNITDSRIKSLFPANYRDNIVRNSDGTYTATSLDVAGDITLTIDNNYKKRKEVKTYKDGDIDYRIYKDDGKTVEKFISIREYWIMNKTNYEAGMASDNVGNGSFRHPGGSDYRVIMNDDGSFTGINKKGDEYTVFVDENFNITSTVYTIAATQERTENYYKDGKMDYVVHLKKNGVLDYVKLYDNEGHLDYQYWLNPDGTVKYQEYEYINNKNTAVGSQAVLSAEDSETLTFPYGNQNNMTLTDIKNEIEKKYQCEKTEVSNNGKDYTMICITDEGCVYKDKYVNEKLVSRIVTYKADGNIHHIGNVSQREYTYDENGNTIKTVEKDKNCKIVRTKEESFYKIQDIKDDGTPKTDKNGNPVYIYPVNSQKCTYNNGSVEETVYSTPEWKHCTYDDKNGDKKTVYNLEFIPLRAVTKNAKGQITETKTCTKNNNGEWIQTTKNADGKITKSITYLENQYGIKTRKDASTIEMGGTISRNFFSKEDHRIILHELPESKSGNVYDSGNDRYVEIRREKDEKGNYTNKYTIYAGSISGKTNIKIKDMKLSQQQIAKLNSKILQELADSAKELIAANTSNRSEKLKNCFEKLLRETNTPIIQNSKIILGNKSLDIPKGATAVVNDDNSVTVTLKKNGIFTEINYDTNLKPTSKREIDSNGVVIQRTYKNGKISSSTKIQPNGKITVLGYKNGKHISENKFSGNNSDAENITIPFENNEFSYDSIMKMYNQIINETNQANITTKRTVDSDGNTIERRYFAGQIISSVKIKPNKEICVIEYKNGKAVTQTDISSDGIATKYELVKNESGSSSKINPKIAENEKYWYQGKLLTYSEIINIFENESRI